MTDTTREQLEKSAAWYTTEQLSIDKEMIRHRFDMQRPFFRGTRALELGPAEGQMTPLILSHFPSVTVVEGSETLLNQIPDHPNLTKIHSLFETWECTEPFDTIIMDHILEHVSDPIQILTKAKTWLADDGVLLVGVPNALSFHRLAAVKMGLLKSPDELDKRDFALGHQRVYTHETLKKDLQHAGWKIIHFGGLLLKPFTYFQMEKIMTPEILRAFVELGKEYPENSAELFAACHKATGASHAAV